MPATGLSLETDTALALSQVQIRPIDSPLIANYTFNGDTSGWIAVTGATLSVVDSRLRVTISSGQSGARVEVPTVIGQQYRITGSSFAGTASSREFRIGTTIGGAGIANVVDGNLDVTFIATTTTTHVYCRINNAGYADFDDIYFRQELREVDTAIGSGIGLGLGRSDETDTAITSGTFIAIATGLATEADTSLSRTATHLKALGLSIETDVSLDLTEVLISPVGLSLETETALAENLALSFTTATETDTGLALGYVQAGTVKMAQERNYSWPSGPNASIDFIDGYSSMFGKNLRNYPPKAFQLSHKRLKTFTSPNFSKGRPR